MAGNDVDELRQYVAAHAESLGIAPQRYRAVLDAIRHDGDGPGSWVHEWSRAAAALEATGDLLGSAQHFTFARFPFIDGAPRRAALQSAVRTTAAWAATQPDIRRELLPLAGPDTAGPDTAGTGSTLPAWVTGLDATPARPLLLICGGIVSIKEQWAPVLLVAQQLGLAAVVIEMPGVGENPLPYRPQSWRLLPAVLDALAGRAAVTHTIAMALSFSGQFALRAAREDTRIRGIVTAGAPVHGPFADPVWQRRLPKVTVDTLAAMAGVKPGDLPGLLAPWALSGDDLAAVRVPVHYVASSRDEIIPPGDLALLRAYVADLHVLEHDDVHGAPRHAAATREWMVRAVAALCPS